MNPQSQLIVFEGVDAAGKSSICEKVIERLRAKSVAASLLSFPGKAKGTIGDLVYQIQHEPAKYGITQQTALSLQALHIAAHLDAIETIILPKLSRGEIIVLDRYWWSTWVYGIAGGANVEVLNALIETEQIAWGSWQPTALFYVTRKEPLREEPMDHWHRIKLLYDKMIYRETGKYPIHVIENERDLETSVDRVLQFLAF